LASAIAREFEVIRTEIEIARPVEDVCWHLLDTDSWKLWWGGNFKEVRPDCENRTRDGGVHRQKADAP
jgi:uncharacterized protein YndB with AHSA1/START domain